MRMSIRTRTGTLILIFGGASCLRGSSSLGGNECDGSPCADAAAGAAGASSGTTGGATSTTTGGGTTTGSGGTTGGGTTTGSGGATGGTTTGGGATGGGSGGTAGTGGAAGAGVGDASSDGCTPAFSCTSPGSLYCGLVDTGCGPVDCGSCSGGRVCGLRFPSVCGAPCPLCAQIPRCERGTTSVSGTVVTGAMSGADPVSRALVYIPNIVPGAKLPPLVDGPTCDSTTPEGAKKLFCTPPTSDEALATAVTIHDGTFTLTDVPAGPNIPLVVELGRWRYETTINVSPCVDNQLPPGTARFPRSQSEGSIPLTAISTGNVDALECVLRKMGIADSEFTNPTGSGRIHLYRNNGASIDGTTPDQDALTGGSSGTGAWDRYDQILFPCEGTRSDKSSSAIGRFFDFTARGGRILATHFSYTWLYHTSGFDTGGWNVDQVALANPLIANIDTTSPQHADFARWLEVVGALSNLTPAQISISDPRRDLDGLLASGGSSRWIYSDMPATVQLMTVDTPVPPNGRTCGRVTYSDFHVANAVNAGLEFPAECTSSPLTPQEKVLEFMILDLTACGWASKGPPPPPPQSSIDVIPG